VRRMSGPFSPAVAMAMANLKQAGVAGAAEEIEMSLRARLGAE
jgi:hypothetical protein